MSYILDIETRGDKRLLEVFLDNIQAPKTYKDPDKIEAYIQEKREDAAKQMATDPDFCEIICIGIKEEGKPAVLMSLQEYAAWLNQTYIAENGGAQVKNLYRKMITFNGKQFDIPIILRAAIKQGVQIPFLELLVQCDKYKAKNHIDLMQELSVGYNNYKSLDKYLQIYLGIAKKPIDFNVATEQDIREHCLEDLENTEKLFNKFRPFFVWVNPKSTPDVKGEILV